MARTARTLITAAARSAGIIESVEALSNDDANTALDELNNIIETWNLDSLFPNTILEYTFNPPALVDGQISIGPTTGSVDIEAPRPNRVVAVASLREGRYYPLEYISPSDIAKSNVRNNVNQAVDSAYYTVYMDTPDIVIKMYPIMDATDYLISAQSTIQPMGFNDEVNVPEGYYPALQYELAYILAVNFGNVEMAPLLEKRAKETLARVKRLNNKGNRLTHDGTPGTSAREFDIRTGSYLR